MRLLPDTPAAPPACSTSAMPSNDMFVFPRRVDDESSEMLSEQEVLMKEACSQMIETERNVTELCWLAQKRSSVLGSAPLLEWSKLIQMMRSMLMSCNQSDNRMDKFERYM